MQLIVATGQEAVTLLADDGFRQAYHTLYARCSWATAFQHLDFVSAWYEHYGDRFSPVIVARLLPGRLTGVLPLALDDDGALAVAGAHQAEYQCWLAAQEDEDFLPDTLDKLRTLLPNRPLRFLHLPPGIPLTPLQRPALARLCRLESVARPLIATQEPEVARWPHGRNRTKMNALKRMGDLRFARLAKPEEWREHFDAILLQHELRQGIKTGLRGFSDDPCKAPFFHALFDKGLLHVTTLTVDNRLVAAHLGLRSRSEVHLAVLTSSVLACDARHSPGQLHLMLLAKHLAAENIPALDLTPYGEFKSRLATRHDIAHALTVHATRAARMGAASAAGARRVAREALTRMGVTRPGMEKAVSRLRNGPARSASADSRLYRVEVDALRHHHDLPGRPVKNRMADLVHYEGKSPADRRAFLTAAIRRQDEGCELYTRVEAGRLVYCAWVRADADSRELPVLDGGRALPQGAVVVFDLYLASRRGGHRNCVAQLCAALAARPLIKSIYILTPARNLLLRATLAALGFTSAKS